MKVYITETWREEPYSLPDENENPIPVRLSWCEVHQQYVYRDGSHDDYYYISCIGMEPAGDIKKVDPRWKFELPRIIVDEWYGGNYNSVTFS